ncbi:MAG TPA: TraB/GumN family protein [Burkholderiales bacterium]|nr:TraB/GumN family protein [Burkholderiales bacterium]
MLAGALDLLAGERELRTAWRIARGGRASYLAGAARFFPYRFRRSIARYLARVDRLVLEGPLDDEAMRGVVARGATEGSARGLAELLDPATILRINAALGMRDSMLGLQLVAQAFLGGKPGEAVCVDIEGLRPWMAFYRIWTQYLGRHGFTHRIELDALRAAEAAGRPVHYLETIEEQVAALEGIPAARFVAFMRDADWDEHRRALVRNYLRGALDAIEERARDFPAYCESVVHKRNPTLYARMRPHLEAGGAFIMIGIVNCPGIVAAARADGHEVSAER